MCGRDLQFRPLKEDLYKLRYQSLHPLRRKRLQVDIDKEIKRWVEVIIKLSTAHDKKDLDWAEFATDDLYRTILKAPVKQLRQFYEALCRALEADKRVPFFVWQIFLVWREQIAKLEKDGAIELKTKLAEEIARMVEDDVKPDLFQAIAGALQWRAREDLEKIKLAKQNGKKARMVGRESCLFLDLDGTQVML